MRGAARKSGPYRDRFIGATPFDWVAFFWRASNVGPAVWPACIVRFVRIEIGIEFVYRGGVYGALRRWSLQHFRARRQGSFLVASLGGLIGYAAAGLYGSDVRRYYLLSLPGALVAITIGRPINSWLWPSFPPPSPAFWARSP